MIEERAKKTQPLSLIVFSNLLHCYVAESRFFLLLCALFLQAGFVLLFTFSLLILPVPPENTIVTQSVTAFCANCAERFSSIGRNDKTIQFHKWTDAHNFYSRSFCAWRTAHRLHSNMTLVTITYRTMQKWQDSSPAIQNVFCRWYKK